MPSTKKTPKNKKFVIIAAAAVMVLIVGAVVWQALKPDQPAGKAVTIVDNGEGKEKTYYITPENDEQLATTPALTDDPLTEASVAEQIKVSKEYCSKLEKACFSYPANWQAKDTSSASQEVFEITSPNGTKVLWQTDSPTSTSCGPDEPNAYLSAINGEMADYKQRLLYLGNKVFEYRRLGLIGGDEVAINPKYGTPQLGDMGTCIEQYGPSFTSTKQPATKIIFRTVGTDVLNADDIPLLEVIFKGYRYQ